MSAILDPVTENLVQQFRQLSLKSQQTLLRQLTHEVQQSENDAEQLPPLPYVPQVIRKTKSRDRSAEYAWVAAHQAEYAGQWVALSGTQLVAHSPHYKEVSQQLKAAGKTDALLIFVEG